MKKKIITLAFAATSLGVFASAPTASAAHCVAPQPAAGTEEEAERSPGFSYFGTDHVKEEGHANEGVRHPTPGEAVGAPGASNCNDDVNPSPSTRAPGRK